MTDESSLREVLKDCPFCGGTAAMRENEDGANFIECTKCGNSTNLQYSLKDDGTSWLIERWNNRVAALASQPSTSASLLSRYQAATADIVRRACSCDVKDGRTCPIHKVLAQYRLLNSEASQPSGVAGVTTAEDKTSMATAPVNRWGAAMTKKMINWKPEQLRRILHKEELAQRSDRGGDVTSEDSPAFIAADKERVISAQVTSPLKGVGSGLGNPQAGSSDSHPDPAPAPQPLQAENAASPGSEREERK